MSIRPCTRWKNRLATLTLLGSVCGATFVAGSAPAGEPRAMPPAAEWTASAVPLPPRDPHAKPRAPRPVAEVQTVSQTVIDVVVTPPRAEAELPAAAIDPHGWEAAAPVEAASGRTQIALATPPADAPVASVELPETGLGSAPDFTTLSSSAWTTVASTDPDNPTPLVEAGVMRTDAVFDGIPVLVNDLAPVPTSESDDALRHAIAEFYALAPLPLEDRPELAAPGANPVAPDFAELTPVDTASDASDSAAAPSEPVEVDAEARARIDEALSLLQKPLNSLKLTTALDERKPTDLAAAAAPPEQPEVVWGAPWPDVKLASYRYTVPQFHRPLYFEQPNFERCGTSWWCLSPYVSAANFAGNIFLLPVHAVLQHPCGCQQSLGDCPTCSRYPLCPRCPLAQ